MTSDGRAVCQHDEKKPVRQLQVAFPGKAGLPPPCSRANRRCGARGRSRKKPQRRLPRPSPPGYPGPPRLVSDRCSFLQRDTNLVGLRAPTTRSPFQHFRIRSFSFWGIWARKLRGNGYPSLIVMGRANSRSTGQYYFRGFR